MTEHMGKTSGHSPVRNRRRTWVFAGLAALLAGSAGIAIAVVPSRPTPAPNPPATAAPAKPAPTPVNAARANAAKARSAAAQAPVSVLIRRDDWGIAHVSGKTDADAVYGLAYAQAEDDFPRLENNYIVSLGRLAEADGEKAIWQDLRQRLFVDPDRLKADYARAPVWLRTLMQAWAAGLNAYLADHPQVKPRVIRSFEPWMALAFTEGSIENDFFRAPLTQLQAFYGGEKLAMTADERGLTNREPMGSNSMAIAPSRTRDGHALLLINPHTPFFFRSEAQITSATGLNAYGAVTWGQFFVYQGFNPQAGWAITVSGADNVDEFAETVVPLPLGGMGYRFGKEVRPLTQRPVTLSWRKPDGTLASRRFLTWASHHGPIVRDDGGKWIALAVHNNPLASLQQSWLRMKVRNIADFQKVESFRANATVNTAFADSKGEIGFFLPQFVAKRSDAFDRRAPVDGSNPAADWQGPTELAAIPHVINPASGWVYNSNNEPWGSAGKNSPNKAAFPRYMDQVGTNPRATHAEWLLNRPVKFTLDGLVRAAYDSWLPAFDRLLPPLFAADKAAPDPAHDAAIALLRGWDRRWGLDSTATSLAVFWGEALWAKGAAAAQRDRITMWEWMEKRATPEQRLAALDEALARLKGDFGDWRVPWSEINRFQRNDGALNQTYSDLRPSTPIPFTSVQWGSLAAFRAQRMPGTKRYYGYHGNGFVAVVEFGPRVRARAISVGGASGDPKSRHFTDQIDRYAHGELRPIYFYPDDLARHTTSARVLVRH